MFDPVTLDHAGIVKWCRKSVAAVTKEQVAAAFLASLSTRRLDLRSALGSYAAGRHLPDHRFTKCVNYHGSGDVRQSAASLPSQVVRKT